MNQTAIESPRGAATRAKVVTLPVAVSRHSARTQTASGGLRLTRRGRIVFVLATLLVLVAGFGLGRASTSSAAGSAAAVSTVVQPGDTLWAVARRAAPDRDVRVTVQRIRELNHLGAASLQAGQTLVLPS